MNRSACLRPAPFRRAARRTPLLLPLLLAFASPRAAAAPPEPVTMRVGFTATTFERVNRNDVEAALKVLAENIGRKRGLPTRVRTQLFAGAADFHGAIAAGEVDLAIFDAVTFVSRALPGDFSPAFVTAGNGSSGRRYLLLVRNDSGVNSVGDLRDRTILRMQAPTVTLGGIWLRTLLAGEPAAQRDRFFRAIEDVTKPSAAVLPVFFGRRAACVVDDASFRIMRDLNPQVGARLRAVAESAPLAGAILCIRRSGWASDDYRRELVAALGELHLEPDGRQMLALFRIDRLVPYDESLLATTRELWTRYAALEGVVRT